jgi:hypothetical protein
VTADAGAGIAYQFKARDLHLVAGPGAAGRNRIKVTLDGRAPGADHGADIDADGNGVIDATRLYQLVRQSGSVKQRRFEIRFLDKGAQAFAPSVKPGFLPVAIQPAAELEAHFAEVGDFFVAHFLVQGHAGVVRQGDAADDQMAPRSASCASNAVYKAEPTPCRAASGARYTNSPPKNDRHAAPATWWRRHSPAPCRPAQPPATASRHPAHRRCAAPSRRRDRFFFKADGGVEECRGCRWRRNRLGVVGVGGTYVHESSRNVAHDNCNRVARNLLNIAPNTDFG